MRHCPICKTSLTLLGWCSTCSIFVAEAKARPATVEKVPEPEANAGWAEMYLELGGEG